MKTSTIMRQACKELDSFYWTPAELAAYESDIKSIRDAMDQFDAAIEQGLARGRTEGLAEGMEKGRYEEKLGIAKTLKKQGMSLTMISDATGLTHEEIKDL